MLVQFTIPRGTVELGRVIDTCIARCVERWGGCTVTDGIGYWNPTADGHGFVSAVTVVEPVAVLGVECETDTAFPRASARSKQQFVREWFDNLAVFVRVKGDQHTVYYRMFDGGEARLVGPDTILAGSESPVNKGIVR